MNLTSKLLLFAAFVLVMLLMSYNYRKRKKRIVCFGDSITEAGNRAGGYVKKLAGYLQTEGLDEKYEMVASGISGNKVTDLLNRVGEDVLSKGAAIVIIFIGVNDVWHKLENKGTDAVAFSAAYKELVDKLMAAGIRVILCTPTLIGEKTGHENEQDEDVNLYADMVRSIADENEFPLVDLRKAFMDYNYQHNETNIAYGMLTTDSVHLNERGNQLVADEIWRVLQPAITEV